MGRDFSHNCILIQELPRLDIRSMFPPKSPFRALFGAFYPHPAHKSALRAEGLRTSWHPVNVGGSTVPLATVLPPPAPRRRPSGPAGSGHAPTLPRWLLPDADRRIGKEPNGTRSRRAALSIFSMSPNQAIPADKSNNFFLFPLAVDQPLTILSWQEASNATSSRRARRMAIRRNVCPFLDLF